MCPRVVERGPLPIGPCHIRGPLEIHAGARLGIPTGAPAPVTLLTCRCSDRIPRDARLVSHDRPLMPPAESGPAPVARVGDGSGRRARDFLEHSRSRRAVRRLPVACPRISSEEVSGGGSRLHEGTPGRALSSSFRARSRSSRLRREAEVVRTSAPGLLSVDCPHDDYGAPEARVTEPANCSSSTATSRAVEEPRLWNAAAMPGRGRRPAQSLEMIAGYTRATRGADRPSPDRRAPSLGEPFWLGPSPASPHWPGSREAASSLSGHGVRYRSALSCVCATPRLRGCGGGASSRSHHRAVSAASCRAPLGRAASAVVEACRAGHQDRHRTDAALRGWCEARRCPECSRGRMLVPPAPSPSRTVALDPGVFPSRRPLPDHHPGPLRRVLLLRTAGLITGPVPAAPQHVRRRSRVA